ncbi:MAG TPA: MerR family transcriptional regulator [Fluviicoccus sp.]|jgi:DNA-binding transcriptional MerR regulator|nr:MerR family transcriptional regulator [Fluviicoccus sp.]
MTDTARNEFPQPKLPEEFTIDDLARAAGTTVRNVRAYQDKGILPPPERRGRTGIYTDAHLARLRVIGQLLARGYSIANISELIAAWESGHDLRQLLGLENAITSPWSDDTPTFYDALELIQMFGPGVTQDEILHAARLGMIEFTQEDTKFRVPSPRLLNAGIQLVGEGLPLGELLGIIEGVRNNVEFVADQLVKLVVRLVFDPYGKDRLPPPEDVERLTSLVWRLRPIADIAIAAEVGRAMEKAINDHLSERLVAVMAHMRDEKA